MAAKVTHKRGMDRPLVQNKCVSHGVEFLGHFVRRRHPWRPAAVAGRSGAASGDFSGDFSGDPKNVLDFIWDGWWHVLGGSLPSRERDTHQTRIR